MTISSHDIKSTCHQPDITVDVDLDHLVKVGFAQSPHCRVTFFSQSFHISFFGRKSPRVAYTLLPCKKKCIYKKLFCKYIIKFFGINSKQISWNSFCKNICLFSIYLPIQSHLFLLIQTHGCLFNTLSTSLFCCSHHSLLWGFFWFILVFSYFPALQSSFIYFLPQF